MMKTKVPSQINKNWKNITKIEKYKNLNMTEHKTDMIILKLTNMKKLNSNSMTETKQI